MDWISVALAPLQRLTTSLEKQHRLQGLHFSDNSVNITLVLGKKSHLNKHWRERLYNKHVK